ncbi:hypothetical protein QQP08_015004 [Theobroma cacao]|nr:hypothetical protein QQP08_015004 [Theobroma cacao]
MHNFKVKFLSHLISFERNGMVVVVFTFTNSLFVFSLRKRSQELGKLVGWFLKRDHFVLNEHNLGLDYSAFVLYQCFWSMMILSPSLSLFLLEFALKKLFDGRVRLSEA